METCLLLLLCIGIVFQVAWSQDVECRENEEYLDCGSSCPLTCKNYQESIFCTRPCSKGCFCKHGYVRNVDSRCILPQDCPVGPCGTNEIRTDCVSPCNDCAFRGKCISEFCRRGCDCKPDYFRNSTGHCVLARNCDISETQCPRHEHYVSCVNICNDCWNRGDCDQPFCQPGCDCQHGYFRNENEECVPERQCITLEAGCGVNEEYTDCVVSCNDCQTRGNCFYTCEYGCDCKSGYYRNEKGECISAAQCSASETGIEPRRACRNCKSKMRCKEGEEFYICKPLCQTTCDNYRSRASECTGECQSGCACKRGLVRDGYGSCIPPEECPTECGANEEYSHCGSPCPLTCANFGKYTSCLQRKDQKCVKGCVCIRGYVRGPSGTCIRPNLCPKECGENEWYRDCGSPCPLTCTNATQSARVSCPNICVKGCFCKPGYVRGPYGNCIPISNCPVVCKENEEFRMCGPSCPDTCKDPEASKRCENRCVQGCFCMPGFVRGPRGNCIQKNLCPAVCKENEVFRNCGPPCQLTCNDTDKVTPPCPRHCVRGCFCRPGYIRGPDGRCILPGQCPKVCQENEVFRECGTACEKTCDNVDQVDVPCRLPCKRGCFCKPGYIRGPGGKCILPAFCPVVCGINEEFRVCGTACPGNCSHPFPSGNCPKICIKGCFCKSGFVRGPTGRCIQVKFCPPVVCGRNEEFRECGPGCEITCTDLRNPGAPCTRRCVRGCFCKAGFLRGPDGSCIPPNLCPTVCGANEEFKECGPVCQPNCTNPNNRQPCMARCVKGCFCRPGFVRGPRGICIPLANCSTELCTKPNEEFKECGPACIRTCQIIDGRRHCPTVCIRGCFCLEGFVRDIDGNCIDPEKCPKEPQKCPDRERFYVCMPPCRNTCSTLNSTAPCNKVCRPGCFCRPGLIRRADGLCIQPRNCPGRRLIGGRNRNEIETTTVSSTETFLNETFKETSSTSAQANISATTVPAQETSGSSVEEKTSSVSLQDKTLKPTGQIADTTKKSVSTKSETFPPTEQIEATTKETTAAAQNETSKTTTQTKGTTKESVSTQNKTPKTTAQTEETTKGVTAQDETLTTAQIEKETKGSATTQNETTTTTAQTEETTKGNVSSQNETSITTAQTEKTTKENVTNQNETSKTSVQTEETTKEGVTAQDQTMITKQIEEITKESVTKGTPTNLSPNKTIPTILPTSSNSIPNSTINSPTSLVTTLQTTKKT